MTVKMKDPLAVGHPACQTWIRNENVPCGKSCGCIAEPPKEAETGFARHKWADVIDAVGKRIPVQWCRTDTLLPHGWQEPTHHTYSWLVLGADHLKWRIKPTPKPDVVKYIILGREKDRDMYHTDGVWDSVPNHVKYVVGSHSRVIYPKIGTLKVTLDGETGQLKAVDIVK